MSKKLHLVSLGCTKNLVDSEVMLGKLRNYEITDDASSADIIIVNTCGFIDAAKSESINTILELDEQRKEDSLLIASGCLSERYREELQREIPEIDIFTGVGDYAKIDELIAKKSSHFSDEVFLIGAEERVITGSKIHAYIKIGEGCNQLCSFCAIPSFKGKLKSRELDTIVHEVENLVKKGYRDFSFISQDSSSYLRDRDIKDGLIELIKAIEKIEGVSSARILYLYPSTTSPKLIERIQKSKIFKSYFDIPIQHITDNMLKKMRRGMSRERHLKILEMMQNSGSFVRTSVILGHPGESEEDFEELLEFLKKYAFDRVNIFAYSDEEGTKAATMRNKVDETTLNERIKKATKVVKNGQKNSLKRMLHQEIEVIVEERSSEHDYFYSARDSRWAPEIDGEILINDSECGTIEPYSYYIAKVTEIAGENLVAKLVQKVAT